MDIGGHRFFSKDAQVMSWWGRLLKLEAAPVTDQFDRWFVERGADPTTADDVMLVRSRLSRIYYGGEFFDYPVTLNGDTLRKLGLARVWRLGWSYLAARLRPRPVDNLEDFYVNRFGWELYRMFFQAYTEKVWGVPVAEIAADWGAQRVKGLSVTGAVAHAARQRLHLGSGRKGPETSLIEYFLYPKLGPGSMWERVAEEIGRRGGEVRLGQRVEHLHVAQGRVVALTVRDVATGETETISGDFILSTMPVRDLVAGLDAEVPTEVARIAAGLQYRDFITVGVLARSLRLTDAAGRSGAVKDNWIYVQEPHVKVGRLQFFHNWSPYLVADPATAWIGMEYFADQGDELWTLSDEAMQALAVKELAAIGVVDPAAVLDTVVVRVPKAYPAYFGTYGEFATVRTYLDQLTNLYLLGRNGQHRYNNQDHSMLTAFRAVDAITRGYTDKAAVWAVNSEEEYHEAG
jgi:protoporphyrinogen oxidase